MAPATDSQPQIKRKIVVVRLISASFRPVPGTHSLLNGQSSPRVVACYGPMVERCNLFALMRAFYWGSRLYPRPAAPYDRNPRRQMIKESEELRLRPKVRTSLLAVACALGLAACAGPQATHIRSLPERVELTGVPAFRGDTYQGGPATLASMLSQQGIVITPGLLEKPLRLPQAQADLERNMQGLAREYGMLVYPLEARLPALLAQVAAGYPVMVRITEGSTLWAEPRYAVLVGFNQRKHTLLLRVGRERRHLMEFGDFESAWKDAGQWAVLVQRPNQLPADVNPQKWQQAADATARAGQERAAAQALKVMADKTAKP